MLAYTLVSEAVYPAQIKRAALVLAHLIQHTGGSSSTVFLACDSAGGNSALSLLSHIAHSYSDVFAIELESPLGGALLLSSRVGFRTKYSSFDTNATLDMLPPLACAKLSAMFLGKAKASDSEADPGPISPDAWTEACLNPSIW